jgi:hypothetical protein
MMNNRNSKDISMDKSLIETCKQANLTMSELTKRYIKGTEERLKHIKDNINADTGLTERFGELSDEAWAKARQGITND